MRTRNRRDANQQEIVNALERIGAHVFDLSRVGGGCPDLLVTLHDKLYLLEIKTEKGKLTPKQIVVRTKWPSKIVRTPQEALEAIGIEVMK